MLIRTQILTSLSYDSLHSQSLQIFGGLYQLSIGYEDFSCRLCLTNITKRGELSFFLAEIFSFSAVDERLRKKFRAGQMKGGIWNRQRWHRASREEMVSHYWLNLKTCSFSKKFPWCTHSAQRVAGSPELSTLLELVKIVLPPDVWHFYCSEERKAG